MSHAWKRHDRGIVGTFAVEVVEGVFAGELTVRRVDDPQGAIFRVPATDVQPELPVATLETPVTKYDARQWAEAVARGEAARRLIALGAARTNADVVREAERLGITSRTVRRDLKLMKATDHPAVLIPNKGGRPAGTSLLDPEVEGIIEEAIDEIYLAQNRPTLTEVAAEIQASCRLQGLVPPSNQTVAKRIERRDAYQVLKRRRGAKAAKYTLQAMPGNTLTEALLDCIQIDHTMADVILRSDDEYRTILGRPWVTLAIDVRSRMVVGFYVTFDAPSALSVGMCMMSVLSPKEPYLRWLGLDAPWPSYGRPKLIYVDNGKDFHSLAFERGCQSIGTDLQYRPVGSPHYGGIIERLMGTMMGKCRLLPGTTHRNVVERGDYDAESASVMTLSEFRRWFANEIVTQYHLSEHRALGASPLTEWNKLVAATGSPPTLTGQWTEAEVLAAFLPAEPRRIRRDGVQLHCIRYWHPALTEWIGDEESRLIHYDPRDIRYVYVRAPGGEVVRAEAITPQIPDASLSEWDSYRAERARVSHDPVLQAAQDRGLLARRVMIRSATEATKAARRTRRADTSREQAPPSTRWQSAPAAAAQTTPRPALPHASKGTNSLSSSPAIYDGELWS